MEKPKGLLLTIVFLAALGLRAVLMGARGDFLEFDEAFYLLIARNLAAGQGYVMNGLPQVAFPPLPAIIYAAVGWLVGDLVRASRIVSVVLGAALVFPVAGLARRAFGGTAAILAATLVAVLPSLLTFVPVSRSYAESLYFGPEPIVVLLFAGAGLFLARTLDGGRTIDAVACGSIAALAYLTRNEAIVLVGATLIVIAIRSPQRLRCALAFVLTAAAVALPYPLYLHEVTGRWSISGKDSSAVLIRESIVAKVRDGDPSEFESIHYALAPGNQAMVSTYWGFDRQVPEHAREPEGLLRVSPRGMMVNVSVYLTRLLPIIFPWYLWPFALAGAVLCFIRRKPGAILAMAAMAAPSLIVCLLLFVEPRHHLYLVPVLAVLSAGGLAWPLEEMQPRRLRLGGAILLAAIAAAMLATDLGQLKHGDAERRSFSAMRDLGRALDATLPPDSPIMSWHPAIAYYADRPWRVMPAAAPRDLAAYARARGVERIVYETAVHGVPPGGDPGVPFTLVELTDREPTAIESGSVSFRFLESAGLYQRYALVQP